MRRLYLQVYVAILAILFVFALLVGAAWHLGPGGESQDQAMEGVGALAAELLPAAAPPADLQRALTRLAGTLDAELTLWDAAGAPLASSGALVRVSGRGRPGWRADRGGFAGAVRLPDGRWLAARRPHRHARPAFGVLAALALLAVSVAVGAYPVARRLTRRVERLRAGVEGLGGGDLGARVPVEGRDEIADLARTFNRAADRIQGLVGAQRTLLASASHELRSPLARIRVALELPEAASPELRARVAGDIAELDELIGELLLASRLETAQGLPAAEDVDLLGLVAEEAARTGAEAAGEALVVRGDPGLLRHLVRNLLENARRHGAPPVEARVEAAAGQARLQVRDRGAGVPEAERERVFDPFYRPPGTAAAGGAGLGLFLVREIARRHGGDARYVAREGGGACFEVLLPRT